MIAIINLNFLQIPRLIKVEQADTPYFRIISPDNVGHKVAPGCASVFRIIFTPDEQQDYRHEAICITEREKFVVPIYAIGARPLLDFPDELYFQVGRQNYHVCTKLFALMTMLLDSCGKIIPSVRPPPPCNSNEASRLGLSLTPTGLLPGLLGLC